MKSSFFYGHNTKVSTKNLNFVWNSIKMQTKKLRKKLIVDFGKFIQDDTKLEVLEAVFDAINNEDAVSVVSSEHYLKVEEARTEYIYGIGSANSWEEVEQRLNAKYGF